MDWIVEHKGRRYWNLVASDLYAGDRPRIDWASLLPPDTGSREQRSALITATKYALEAMIMNPRCPRTGLSYTTVKNWFGIFKGLAHWMVLHGLWRFRDLTPESVAAYLRTIQPRRGSPRQVSLLTVRRHMYVLRCLWEARSNFHDGLAFDVNHFEDELIGGMSLRETLPWRPLSDADAIRLLRVAKEWTTSYAEYVGTLLARLWAEQDAVVGVTRHNARRRRNAFYRTLAQEPDFVRLAEKLGMTDGTPNTVLNTAVKVLEGAALTSILFLVGLRARETVRLDADCVATPDDGDPEKLLLAGIAAKKQGRSRTWAITGAVKDAVDALRLVFASPRELSAQPSLLLDGAVKKCGLFPGSNVPKRALPFNVTVKMRCFARVAFPLEPLLAKQVHAHAARKTFARFVVMRDKRVLESLAYHFGHTHRAITDGYYVGADIELAKLIDTENRGDLSNSLTDLLSSRNIGGKAGKAFIANRESISPKLRGRAVLKSMVDRLISQGVQLAPCDWGYCVYSKALSACHGDAKGPNDAERTAEVCGGCANFVVTQRHRAWWEERVIRDEQFLKRNGLPEQTVMVVQRRLSQSKGLLTELNADRIPAAAPGVREDENNGA